MVAGLARRLGADGAVLQEDRRTITAKVAAALELDRRRAGELDVHVRWLIWTQPLWTRLQLGPTCGLVALSIVARVLGTVPAELRLEGHAEIDALLALAKALGVSAQGEMFSCHSLAELGRDAYALDTTVMAVPPVIAPDGRKQWAQWLRDGHLLLVPYDRDKDHRPCRVNGQQAHWFLVKGLAVPTSGQAPAPMAENDAEQPAFDWHEVTGDDDGALVEAAAAAAPDDVYVVGLHGKSRHQAVWRLADLVASNAQLHEPSPEVLAAPTEYVFKPGLHELRGWAVLVKRQQNTAV